MAFIYQPYRERSFLARTVNTIITRRPERALNGWLKMESVPTREMLGYRALLDLWQFITQELGQAPVVVESTEFRYEPRRVLEKYCAAVGIPFDPGMLTWKQQAHRTWDPELMQQEQYAKWQQILNQSTRILPEDPELPPIPPEHRRLPEDAYKVYDALRAHAL
ncbi:MAG: hypothetical protein AAGN35_26680 [Bacteroidota bacterium]